MNKKEERRKGMKIGNEERKKSRDKKTEKKGEIKSAEQTRE